MFILKNMSVSGPRTETYKKQYEINVIITDIVLYLKILGVIKAQHNSQARFTRTKQNI